MCPAVGPDERSTRQTASTTSRRSQTGGTTGFERPRRAGLPVRYADDFIILVSVPPAPIRESWPASERCRRRRPWRRLRGTTLGLELSEAKTLVTPVTSTLRFLGHHVRVRQAPVQRPDGQHVRHPAGQEPAAPRAHQGPVPSTNRRDQLGTAAHAEPDASRMGLLLSPRVGREDGVRRLDNTCGGPSCDGSGRSTTGQRSTCWHAATAGRSPAAGRFAGSDGRRRPVHMASVTRPAVPSSGGCASSFASTIDGEPGAQRKVHAGFGRGRRRPAGESR